MKPSWIAGNRARLLENGEQFFPAVFDALRAATIEVLLETFILFDDKVGAELRATLIEISRRGVKVDVLIDGFGSADLGPGFLGGLSSAGVRVRSFDPSTRVFGWRVNLLRRMHRKIVVVDGRLAFVGGINFSAEHLADYGPLAKQDYAVLLEGAIVGDVRRFALTAIRSRRPADAARREPAQASTGTSAGISAGDRRGAAEALFVTRDNVDHTNDIERHYRTAIRSARHRVLIANAYFFPGYRLLREMRRAARRGVDVQLVLQGKPDMAFARSASTLLYEHLQHDGVTIHEYVKRPLHAKVAVVDGVWSTVGSSNLDPLSLSLNLEANVMIRDAAFAAALLTSRLEHLIAHECRPAVPPAPSRWTWWNDVRSALVFHFLRKFPGWASRLPAHAPRLEAAAADGGASTTSLDARGATHGG